ncbi:CBS domain-containing protein [Kibdelosporangium banguiense]|uniref:CBS domain-containing protein n=1 Tax=Kibdelosporangium banguiense TaxID=1365924 RepID=A0ABS4TXL8_9PSEU|nr:CBS domain-containing protein [Kibdelosporangium banguiense]MBP2328763.1 CBS domain-containing protein [Kibdelosporangium banguiense]
MTTAVQPYAVELASAPVLSVDTDVDALAALRVMHANQIRHLPVLSRGACVGLVSETELLTGLLSRTRGPLPTSGELCHRPPPTVDDRATLADAARVMRETASDAVVVFSGQQVVGVLTAVDFVQSFAREGADDD